MVIKQAEHTTAQAAELTAAELTAAELTAAELTAAELTADGPPKTAEAPVTAGALWQWRGGDDIAALCAATGAAGESVLISGGDRAKRWNPVTGEPAGRPPAGHHGNVTALVSMPGDGLSTALASGAADGTVRVWNLEAAQPIAAFTVQHAADGLRSAASASQPAHAIPAAPD
jgi:hypothetical protein